MLGPQFAGIAASKVLGASGLLLDDFPNAAAAYSLRKLRSDYSGSAIRVRESGGNTEADIGFDGNDLDETALLNHCGANDGFVVTWYDQSGNGNNATNSTASEQDKLVSLGSVLQVNSRPAVTIVQGSGYALDNNISVETAKRFSAFGVFSPENVDNDHYLSQFSGANWVLSFGSDDTATANEKRVFYDGSWRSHSGAILTGGGTQYVLGWLRIGDTSMTVRVNGSQHGGSITVGNNDRSASAATYLSGASGADTAPESTKMQELIHYAADKSADASGIETNQNDYFGVF